MPHISWRNTAIVCCVSFNLREWIAVFQKSRLLQQCRWMKSRLIQPSSFKWWTEHLQLVCSAQQLLSVLYTPICRCQAPTFERQAQAPLACNNFPQYLGLSIMVLPAPEPFQIHQRCIVQGWLRSNSTWHLLSTRLLVHYTLVMKQFKLRSFQENMQFASKFVQQYSGCCAEKEHDLDSGERDYVFLPRGSEDAG